jgi:hypothetical protein
MRSLPRLIGSRRRRRARGQRGTSRPGPKIPRRRRPWSPRFRKTRDLGHRGFRKTILCYHVGLMRWVALGPTLMLSAFPAEAQSLAARQDATTPANAAGESCAMNPENEGPRRRGMEKVGVDGTLEADDHNRREQQRHREIEISIQNPVTTGHGERARFFSRAYGRPDAFPLFSVFFP